MYQHRTSSLMCRFWVFSLFFQSCMSPYFKRMLQQNYDGSFLFQKLRKRLVNISKGYMDKLWVLILFNNNNNLSSYLLNAVKTSFTEQRIMSTLSNAMYNVEAKCCELIFWSLFFFKCQFNFVERRGNIQCSLILFLQLHYQIIFSCNLKQKDHKVQMYHITLHLNVSLFLISKTF